MFIFLFKVGDSYTGCMKMLSTGFVENTYMGIGGRNIRA